MRGMVTYCRALPDVALWVGLTERGLPTGRPFPSLTDDEATVIYDLAPGLLAWRNDG